MYAIASRPRGFMFSRTQPNDNVHVHGKCDVIVAVWDAVNGEVADGAHGDAGGKCRTGTWTRSRSTIAAIIVTDSPFLLVARIGI